MINIANKYTNIWLTFYADGWSTQSWTQLQEMFCGYLAISQVLPDLEDDGVHLVVFGSLVLQDRTIRKKLYLKTDVYGFFAQRVNQQVLVN